MSDAPADSSPESRSPSISVEKGRILAYRVFDAGDTISLERAEKVEGARRVDVGGPLTEGLVIPAAPVELDLDPCELVVERLDAPLRAKVSARVFEFGAVSIVYAIEIEPGMTLEALTPLCDAIYDSRAIGKRGVEHRAEVMRRLGDCVESPHEWDESETYTILFVEKLAGATLGDLARSEQAAKLLLGETSARRLSDSVRDDVLAHRFSYLADDLVIVDWNSAIVVEPSGTMIVPFVLELATSQLLEFRYYDRLLDRELARVYDHVERARPRIIRSPYAALTREVLRRIMELTEVTERVDNSIKAIGDFWLARVYLTSLKRFRVPEWRESVEAKLALVGRAYGLLKGDVDTWRAHLLEMVVVLLILLELINSLASRH